jgi:hypothetical protein
MVVSNGECVGRDEDPAARIAQVYVTQLFIMGLPCSVCEEEGQDIAYVC